MLNVSNIYWIFRNPLAQMEEEKREHDTKLKKMEQEMEQVFEMKVKEKKQKLKDSEIDVSLLLLESVLHIQFNAKWLLGVGDRSLKHTWMLCRSHM